MLEIKTLQCDTYPGKEFSVKKYTKLVAENVNHRMSNIRILESTMAYISYA